LTHPYPFIYLSPLTKPISPHLSIKNNPNNKRQKDDKMLMVWDLRPNVDIPSIPQSRSLSRSRSLSPSSSSGASPLNASSRPQPTAYVISFPHALSSVCAHASTTKDLLVADVRGSLALIDWRSDPSHAQADAAWHHPRVIELAAPRAIAGGAAAFPASAAWQQANPDMYVPPPFPSPPLLSGRICYPPFTLIDVTLTPHACPFSFLKINK
jgi:hypothetical protein